MKTSEKESCAKTNTELTDHNNNKKTESQRALLPEMRPQAKHIPVQQRAGLLLAVHREVHVGVEPGQHNLHQPVTERAIRFVVSTGAVGLKSMLGVGKAFASIYIYIIQRGETRAWLLYNTIWEIICQTDRAEDDRPTYRRRLNQPSSLRQSRYAGDHKKGWYRDRVYNVYIYYMLCK